MRLVKVFLLSISLLAPTFSFAQEATKPNAFISDELFIYMHAGAGKNYRILGTINSGSEITLTGNEGNGFSEIIDPKNRKTWVETQYISTTPSLRNVIVELNSKLTDNNKTLVNTENLLASAKSEVEQLSNDKATLTKQAKQLKAELVEVKSKLKHQDQEILLQWFFNGAIVLGVGFLFGIILPRFTGKKRQSSSWS